MIAGFAFIFGSDFVIHALWLAPDYKATASLWRVESEVQRRFILLLFAQFLCAISFFYVWAKTGWRRRTIADGFWFGFWLGAFQQVGTIVLYVIMPMPWQLALKWFLSGMLQAVLLGMLASLLYKPRPILGDRQP
jgi:hypothetical protein